MKKHCLFLAVGAGLFLASCSKTPGVTYPLSADRLAWQPYRQGQVVRYANSRTATIRTYAVTQVFDRLEKERVGINWVPLLPGREPDEYQNVTVTMQRTDSAGVSFPVMDLVYSSDPNYATGLFFAAVGWETLGRAQLPLDELNQGVPFDTTQYRGVKVVPAIRLGAATYSNVLEIKNLYTGAGSPGLPTITRFYFARQQGVLAFEDKATGLWYRLP